MMACEHGVPPPLTPLTEGNVMSYKTILVQADLPDAVANGVRLAAQLANDEQAHLVERLDRSDRRVPLEQQGDEFARRPGRPRIGERRQLGGQPLGFLP